MSGSTLPPRIAAIANAAAFAGGAVAIALLLVALCGCSGLYSAKATKDTATMQHMAPTQARTDVANHLDAIQEVLGGTWTNQDNPLAESCHREGEGGFYYYGARVRTEPIAEFDAAGEVAAEYWTDKGFEVRSIAYRPTHRLVTATAPNGTVIYLKLEYNRNLITAEGPCNEGIWGDVRRSDGNRLDAEKRHSPPPTEMPTGTPTGAVEAPSDAPARGYGG
jgi:hypothetical protein